MPIVDDLKHTVTTSKPVQAAAGALRSLHLDAVDGEVRKVVGAVRTQAGGLPERVTSLAGHLTGTAREQATATLSALGTQGRDLLGGTPIVRRTVAPAPPAVADDAAPSAPPAPAVRKAVPVRKAAAKKVTPAKRVARTAAPGEAVPPVPPTAPVDELPPSLEDEHPTPLTAAQEIANAQAAQEAAADRADDGT